MVQFQFLIGKVEVFRLNSLMGTLARLYQFLIGKVETIGSKS